jgi:hypothetical protein
MCAYGCLRVRVRMGAWRGAEIDGLGGRVLQTALFSPECTHVIVGVPSRSEKFLAAMAAGKWSVVNPDSGTVCTCVYD